MDFIYIIVEYGSPYPMAYKTYKLAVAAVKEKHVEYLEEQIKELKYLTDIENLLANINTPEDIISGVSKLYIEKGINIEIHKLPIKSF